MKSHLKLICLLSNGNPIHCRIQLVDSVNVIIAEPKRFSGVFFLNKQKFTFGVTHQKALYVECVSFFISKADF